MRLFVQNIYIFVTETLKITQRAKACHQIIPHFSERAFVNVHGQNITFNHLTTDDGLSQFSVNSLYVDENGILWIGTREGLNRYNGEDIKTYKLQKNDPNSLFCNTVLRIVGNHNEKIYLLCTEGVAEFDLASQKFTTLLQGNINSIYYNNGLFIGKRTKYTATMKKPETSTYIINCPPEIWKSFVCTLIKVTFGWVLPPTVCIA